VRASALVPICMQPIAGDIRGAVIAVTKKPALTK
jgi:hypothetical protein